MPSTQGNSTMRNPGAPPSFAALVQSFFAEHLTKQRDLSARTVAAYRDAFMLFLEFAEVRLHKPPTAMQLTDITPALILAFLDHLESVRHKAESLLPGRRGARLPMNGAVVVRVG